MKILFTNKFFFLNSGSETVFFQEREYLSHLNGHQVVAGDTGLLYKTGDSEDMREHNADVHLDKLIEIYNYALS